MPKGRRRWHRVADSVAFEPWPNDVLAFQTRLMGYLNTAWARDGLNADEACRVVLTDAQVEQLAGATGRQRRSTSTRVLREWCASVDAVVTESNGSRTRTVQIEWPKFSEFQRYPGQTAPDSRANEGESEDAPAPAPAKKRRTPPPPPVRDEPPPLGEPARPPAKRTASGKRPAKRKAPEDLSPQERKKLFAWAEQKEPWAANPDVIRGLVDACLGHFRAASPRQWKANYYQAVQNWIRNERLEKRRVYTALTEAQGGGAATERMRERLETKYKVAEAAAQLASEDADAREQNQVPRTNRDRRGAERRGVRSPD